MDIAQYPKQKAKNLVTVKKYGQHFQITVAQYDPATGEEILPISQTVTREQYQKDRDLCAERLAAYDVLLADMDRLANG